MSEQLNSALVLELPAAKQRAPYSDKKCGQCRNWHLGDPQPDGVNVGHCRLESFTVYVVQKVLRDGTTKGQLFHGFPEFPDTQAACASFEEYKE